MSFGNISSEVRIPVNGRILAEYIGKTVTIFGTVLQTDKNGSSFDMESTDKRKVTVALRKPLMEPVSGVVEVHGIVKSKDVIVCDYHIAFPSEIASSFDGDLGNQVISIIHNTSNTWKDAVNA